MHTHTQRLDFTQKKVIGDHIHRIMEFYKMWLKATLYDLQKKKLK